MIDSRSLDDIAHRLAQVMPPGLKGLRAEVEQNFRAILQSGLDRLDLVGREQFEVQQELLERTRAKLDRLEKRLAELEKSTPAPAARKAPATPRKTVSRRTRTKPDDA